MPTTPGYAIRYRAPSDPPNIADATKFLAQDIEAILLRMDLAPNVQVYTPGSGNWSKPVGAKYVIAEGQGPGGGGGGVTGAGSGVGNGGGGGGGGWFRKLFLASALGSTEAYVVGSGGAGGGGGATGNAGSAATTFGGCSGGAGNGGGGTVASTSSLSPVGGTGGTASGGDLNIPGSDGDLGRTVLGVFYYMGRGGGSFWAPQTGASTNVAANGLAASGYGGGGSGAVAQTTTRSGGAGSDGRLIVVSYF